MPLPSALCDTRGTLGGTSGISHRPGRHPLPESEQGQHWAEFFRLGAECAGRGDARVDRTLLGQALAPDALQETVRAFLRTWYAELVTGLPEIEGDTLTVSTRPGHGVVLREGVAESPDVERMISAR